LFQDGGAEAFAGAYYSSSEFSATSAWYQAFNSGFQSSVIKDGPTYVRAVRRVPVVI
jgi:hypothetical protein